MPDLPEPLKLRFDDFLSDEQAGALFRVHTDGQIVRMQLGARAFQILCLLVERRGGIVTRHEIMDAVWPNVTVEENNLSVQLSNLRHVLDADRGPGSSVQTLPGRGYRFLPPVAQADRRLADQVVDLAAPDDRTAGGSDDADDVAGPTVVGQAMDWIARNGELVSMMAAPVRTGG